MHSVLHDFTELGLFATHDAVERSPVPGSDRGPANPTRGTKQGETQSSKQRPMFPEARGYFSRSPSRGRHIPEDPDSVHKASCCQQDEKQDRAEWQVQA